MSAKDTRVEVEQRACESLDVRLRRRDRDVEVLCEALASVRLHGDAADRDVLDLAQGERGEQLASVEVSALAHRRGSVCGVTARPARSSAATEFQLSASSRRSDIGRRRAASTASVAARGLRAACAFA
jgi:hypothetical protein